MCGNPEQYVIEKERNLCLWSAYYSLTLQHRALLECYVLNEIKPSQAKKITKLNAKDSQDELILAKNTLRSRFLALYL